MPRAYSYIRFSTPEQAKGDSLRRQTVRTEEWCAKRGVRLDDTLHDFGVSAFKGTNRTTGALRRFLELIESGQIEKGSYLIIESLDRLSREAVLDAASRLFDLIRAGITVVTLSDGQEYSHERLVNDWTPLVFSLVIMARAHEESKVKSERVAAAWRQKKALARTECKPLTPRCPEWLELRDGKYAERPERVAIIHRVFRETIEGLGRREIVRRLNAEQVPTFRGGQGWHTSSIAKIIQSRAVLGEYQPHTGTHRARNRKPDGDPIPDFYPRIVDEDTFWRAQAATQGRRQRAAGRKGDTVHLLQGLARCGSCGSAMHIVNKGRPPKGGIYLCCSSNMRKAGCTNSRRWRVDRLEPALLSGLSFLEVEAFTFIDDETPNAAERVTALRAKLDAAIARRKRWSAIIDEDEANDDDEAKARYAAAAAGVKATRKELQAAKAEASKVAADPGHIQRLTDAATLSRQIEDTDPERRRELRIRLSEVLRGLVQYIECQEEMGAVMVLKPRLTARRLDGVVPFAIRSSTGENGVFEMLLEPDADDETLKRFIRLPVWALDDDEE